jgi:large subunit ribosomal protein L32
MAVPKKRTSKTKKNIRKSVWRKMTVKEAFKAFSIGQSLFNQTNSSESNPTKNAFSKSKGSE